MRYRKNLEIVFESTHVEDPVGLDVAIGAHPPTLPHCDLAFGVYPWINYWQMDLPNTVNAHVGLNKHELWTRTITYAFQGHSPLDM